MPHSRPGKSIYLLLDSGIAAHLGASLTRQLQIAIYNERVCANTYSGGKRNNYYYYQSSGKKHIHLIEESLDGKKTAFQIFDREIVKKPELELLKAFKHKNPRSKICLFAPIREGWLFDGV